MCVEKEMITDECRVRDEMKNKKVTNGRHVWSGVE